MMTTTWRVIYSDPPEVIRYCKKCKSKTGFISTGLFRVNANQKNLDIWLVYQCNNCKQRWNLEVYSRTSVASLDKSLLDSFYHNDGNLALQIGFDFALLKKQGACFKIPHPEITGDVPGQAPAMVRLTGDIFSGEKISSLLRQKMGLSHCGYGHLIESGKLESLSGHCLTSGKFTNEVLLLFHP